jgi:eukaryotic translation initiation factor 2C
LSDDQTANMITVACKPPNQNAAAIVGLGLDELGFRTGVGPLRQFGVSIGDEMAVVPGRILPSPGVHYRQGPQQVDERASWNLKNVKFEIGARLEKWAVLLILDGNRGEFEGINDTELRGIVKGFADMCKKSGMTVDAKDPIFVSATLPRKNNSDPTRWAAITTIRAVLTSIRDKPNLVLTVLSNQDKHIYSGLKYLCDSHLGVPTVCVQATKIRKVQGQLQYYANVALKVNMKLGGVNHSLDAKSMSWLAKQPTMLVGMDVTHPGPGSVKGTVSSNCGSPSRLCL